MYTSVLKKISEFAKENNISINGAYYKFPSNFPEAFHRTVSNYLEKAYSKYSIKGEIDEFFVGFDKNKNAYFEFVGKIKDPNNTGESHKTKDVRVLIFQDHVEYDFNIPPSLIIKENIFLENIKYLDNAIYLEKQKELPIDFSNRFFREYLEGKGIEEYFGELCNNIIDYINYLNDPSNLSYRMLEEEIRNSKEIEKIYFYESYAETNPSSDTINPPRIRVERKNPEIPFEERKKVLDSYYEEKTFEAKSKNSKSVYYVKVFKVKDKCKLIMEPIEGNKYTKVVYLDNKKLETAEIRKIVIKYLELNRNQTTDTKEITRHSHTTLEEYKKLLDYIIKQENRGISSTTKIKIDEANNLKR